MSASATDILKRTAASLGFQYCGIAKAGFLEKEAPRLEKWLNKGYHGTMRYMENHLDKRLDPTKLVSGAKSVVSLLYNYYPEKSPQDTHAPKIAKYAYGEDYHTVIKEKLFALVDSLRKDIGDINGRVFVDSGPVLERAWAERSGLGWIGRHGLLITKQQGSFFFIAELILDIELEPDAPYSKDYCGSCTACVDACPTDAILPDKTLNATQCISYLTIELKDAIGTEFKNKTDNWMFGCDICQDVCPWNRFSKPHTEPRFTPSDALSGMTEQDWTEMTADVFKDLFSRSAVTRTGFEGMQRNIRFLKE